MDTNVRDLLNAQINAEFYSSNLYLQMSAWCADRGLSGAAGFFRRHAEEEREHMLKFFDYMDEAGQMPVVGTLDAPPVDFSDLERLLKDAYRHEQHVTALIYGLVDAANKAGDHGTRNFLEWFVAEQREEESLFRALVDKADLIGTDSRGLYMLDREIAGMDAAESEEGA